MSGPDLCLYLRADPRRVPLSYNQLIRTDWIITTILTLLHSWTVVRAIFSNALLVVRLKAREIVLQPQSKKHCQYRNSMGWKKENILIKKPGPGVPRGLDLATKSTLKWIREKFLEKLSTSLGVNIVKTAPTGCNLRKCSSGKKQAFYWVFAKIDLSMHFKIRTFSKCFLTAAFSQCLRYIWSFIFLQ